LQRTRHILTLCEQTKEDFLSTDDMRGILNIGAAETACVYRLPPILDKFHKLYPLVELRIQTESCEHFYDLLKNNIVDIAFILTDKVRAAEIIARPLFPEELIVVANPAHPLAVKRNITVEDFQQECLIITMPGCGYRPLILSLLEQNHIQPLSFMELSSIATIKECTHCGLGIAILPRVSVADYIQQGKLTELHLPGSCFRISTQIIYHREKWLSPVIKTFLEMCDEVRL
jgi:DNA-binding transcriptional LysR family regulator